MLSALAFTLLGASMVLGADESAKPASAQKAAEVKSVIPATSNLDALSAIFTRRSIRSYTNQPVSDETVKLLLKAAMAAPTLVVEQAASKCTPALNWVPSHFASWL